MESGGTVPAVLNAANEIAVESFLKGRIAFPKIWEIVKRTMESHQNIVNPNLDDVLKADQWAKEKALSMLIQVSKPMFKNLRKIYYGTD